MGTLNFTYYNNGGADALLTAFPGISFEESHFFVGEIDQAYPEDNNGQQTVAPGQFPYKHEDISGNTFDRYPWKPGSFQFDADLFIIAHVVVCGEVTPTGTPTVLPTSLPTAASTSIPTGEPTRDPTSTPTSDPTSSPTSGPTSAPTSTPTSDPTGSPTASPTSRPTPAPTPTKKPTAAPTKKPTAAPTPVVTGASGGCETAYAYAAPTLGTCFDKIDIGNPRWGWSIGPLSAGASYTFDVYAGAAQCVLSKGTRVGTLTFAYDYAQTVTATFTMTAGYEMTVTHFYIGTSSLPKDKNGNYIVAPGQYTAVHSDMGDDKRTDTFTFTGIVDQNIYFVAHAEVCDAATARRLVDGANQPKLEDEVVQKTGAADAAMKTNAGGQSADEAENGTSPDVTCMPAFGYHSSKKSLSFEDLGIAPQWHDGFDITWGWTNGPLDQSNYAYSLNLYAQSPGSASDALEVGVVTVGYDGEEAIVTIDAGDGLWLKEVHAYVGTSRLPLSEDGSEVIDPSQHPVVNRRMSTSRTFVISGFNGESVYAVIHATVCALRKDWDEMAGHAAGVRGVSHSPERHHNTEQPSTMFGALARQVAKLFG